MTPQQEADCALSLWQSYARQSGAAVANGHLHDFFMSPEERAVDEAFREALKEPVGVESPCVSKKQITTSAFSSRFSEAF